MSIYNALHGQHTVNLWFRYFVSGTTTPIDSYVPWGPWLAGWLTMSLAGSVPEQRNSAITYWHSRRWPPCCCRHTPLRWVSVRYRRRSSLHRLVRSPSTGTELTATKNLTCLGSLRWKYNMIIWHWMPTPSHNISPCYGMSQKIYTVMNYHPDRKASFIIIVVVQ